MLYKLFSKEKCSKSLHILCILYVTSNAITNNDNSINEQTLNAFLIRFLFKKHKVKFKYNKRNKS